MKNMFVPKRIIYEKFFLDFDVGKSIYNQFKDNTNIEIINTTTNTLKKHIPGEDLPSQYQEAKKTLVVEL